MSIKDFIDKNKDLRKIQPEVSVLFSKVVTQALRHTTRSEMDDLQSIARPSEEKIYEAWRKSNKRNITPAFITQFVRMMQRVFQQTIKIEMSVEMQRFIFDRLIPLSVVDTNARVVTMPYMEGNKMLPPASGDFLPNMALSKEKIIVYSANIVFSSDTLFIYFKDRIKVNKDTYPRYVAIDTTGYYYVEPRHDKENKIYYEPILWYAHNLGVLPPIGELPGNNILVFENIKTDSNNPSYLNYSKNVKSDTYKESICWPAFENFDEAAIRLSSEQVASIKHANPKLVTTKEIECPTCAGHGFLNPTDPEKKTVCGGCNGTRILTTIGDFSTINLRDTKHPGDSSGNNPVYYLNPPSGIKELRDAFMHFVEMGKMSICNDILEGSPNESGVAKELRLEPKQDLMQSYGQQLCYLIEDLINAEKILGNDNKLITVTPPVYYQTKSPEILKLQITESLQGERYLKYMEYVEMTCRGDELAIKKHKYAALYAPLILYKADEFDGAFNAGVYDERDAIRRDYAFYAVNEVLTKEPNLDNLKEIKEKCDLFLIEMGVLPEPTEVELDLEQRAKILDTVGGG